jgi:hypothetical protein
MGACLLSDVATWMDLEIYIRTCCMCDLPFVPQMVHSLPRSVLVLPHNVQKGEVLMGESVVEYFTG